MASETDTPPHVSVVVPTYREAENLPFVVPRIHHGLSAARIFARQGGPQGHEVVGEGAEPRKRREPAHGCRSRLVPLYAYGAHGFRLRAATGSEGHRSVRPENS